MTLIHPAPSDQIHAGQRPGRSARHPRWTLFATILASSLAFIDGSVVNVALPAIGQSLGASAADLQWTINAYLLPLSALLLLGGAAGDHFGERRLLLAGIALFLLASVGCAIAPDVPSLLASRVLQGVGAAMLMPNSLGILGNAFTGEAKGRAIGTWAAAGAIAGAVGPPLGGWLVEAISWRAIFYLNLPVGAAAMFIAWRYVEEGERSAKPLDWLGALLATLALGFLTWSLTLWSNHRLLTPATWVGLIGGLGLMAAFVAVQHKRGERAMMPLSLFGSRAFVGLTTLTFLLYGALGGLMLLLPYLLITTGGYSPLQAGLALLPFPLLIGLASRWMGRLAERIGPRWPLSIGPTIAGCGYFWLYWLDPASGYVSGILPGLLLISLGMAGAVAPLTTAVLSSVDSRHMGTASGFNSAIARIGGLIATAIAGIVISQQGDAILDAFHGAALVGAALALASGLAAFASLEKG